ncbi:MAG TPA: Calx-beta domain-containing protein [Pyrinomonadaceae bacterium]|nr:Calx-beta domain-containing protein [Pyrinomonadaceae bacterium]
MKFAISLCFLLASVIALFRTSGASTAAQAASSISFGASSYTVEEGARSVQVAVTRTGDIAGAVTVDYATSNGTASERTDFIPALGTLRFAPGETTKTFTVLITDNFTPENSETIDLMLFNPSGGATVSAPDAAVVNITDNDSTPPSVNPIDDTRFFVRQQYNDFLVREPDQAGWDFWTNEIESCGMDAQCREVKRINVSAAFFLSIEFQETGFFVRRLYLFYFAGLSPIWREFMRDLQEVGRGVVVGAPGWEERLEANKSAFIEDWYARHRVVLESQIQNPAFPLTDERYVDGLFQKIGITPTADERRALIDGLTTGTETRATVLRKVADYPAFVQREFRRAFVMTQYFGYLRRKPDFAGFEFWLTKLDQFGGNYIEAEMVKAFISSTEYRERFTQSDALTEAFFEFGDSSGPDTVVFKLNDPARIAEARSLVGKSKIVIGTVIKERIYYNRAWHYHLEPASIVFADGTVEVCDTTLKAVENGLEAVGGSFLPGNVMCPWASRVLREVSPPPH